jgi:predicted flap endonuclease-1-like 5' DNA nuclease
MSRSTRTLIAVMLFVLAGFLILNNIVQTASADSWLFPAALLIIGGILLLYREPSVAVAAPTAEPEPMATLAAATAPKPVVVPPPAPALAEPAAPVAPAPVVEVPVTVVEPYVKEVGEAEPQPAAIIEDHPATYAPVVEVSASTATTAPDDLTIIVGIGPKMQSALRAAGYDTFAKLAVADPDALRTAVAAAGMRLAPTIDTWPEQAKGLMK